MIREFTNREGGRRKKETEEREEGRRAGPD